MNEKFFLKLLELSAAHAKRSHAIFERLNLSNAQPKVLYMDTPRKNLPLSAE